MKIGETLVLGSSLTDKNMVFLKQLGVNHLTVMFREMGDDKPKGKYGLPRLREGTCYETEDLIALRKWVESHGFELSAIGSIAFHRGRR